MKIEILTYVAIYLLVLNGIGFMIMGIDKQKARKKRWRIPEKTFFIVSLLGGSAGTWAGMYAFRHKTRHWYFVIGIPLMLLLQIVGVGYWLCVR